MVIVGKVVLFNITKTFKRCTFVREIGYISILDILFIYFVHLLDYDHILKLNHNEVVTLGKASRLLSR